MRRLIAGARFKDQMLVLHYVGRRSGRRFDVPAGYHIIDGVPSVLTSSGWRYNFTGGRAIEVTLRGERRPALAVLTAEPREVAAVYERLILELGTKQARQRLESDSTSIVRRRYRSCRTPFSGLGSRSYAFMINRPSADRSRPSRF
jgi:hypothetical protein